MLAPQGASKAYDIIIPTINVITDTTAELIVTERKLLNTRIEQSAGKIIRLEISILPISRIPITIVIAVSSAIIILYALTAPPVAFAKLSSKVMAKIFV